MSAVVDTHIQTHINYFCRIITTFEISTVCFDVEGLQQLSVKQQMSSVSEIHKCLLCLIQREKNAKKVEEAAFSQGISVCLLKTNVTAISDVSLNKTKTCTERIIRPQIYPLTLFT